MNSASPVQRASELGQRLQPQAARLLALLATATAQRRLRGLVALLLIIWSVASLLRAVWSLVPPMPPLDETAPPINPALRGEARTAAQSVAITPELELLFGEPGDEPPPAPAGEAAVEEASFATLTEAQAVVALEGIEAGAPESRLPLVLRGVVASTDAGLGQAVIEHQKQQELYRVGDDLPVGIEIKLAKVMPTQVVISNRGRYELLRLFTEDPAIDVTVTSPASRPAVGGASRTPTPAGTADAPADRARSRIAAAYREQLYRDPQSLSDVVSIAAVRADGELRGYRVRPGRAAQEFTALGFRPGDLVTAVNGLSLTDPSNTVRLYQAMRSASEAVFDLQRGDEQITLSVSLDAVSDE